MGKECEIILLLYKAVNNEDEHNNTIKSHSGIMPLNYSMAMDQSDFSIIVVVYNNLPYCLWLLNIEIYYYMYLGINIPLGLRLVEYCIPR